MGKPDFQKKIKKNNNNKNYKKKEWNIENCMIPYSHDTFYETLYLSFFYL